MESARLAAVAIALAVLLPVAGWLATTPGPAASPSATAEAWAITGRQLVELLINDHGYRFGESSMFPGQPVMASAIGDPDYGGSGTVVVREPLDERANVLVMTDLRSAAAPEGGCRYIWRMLDLLVPDPADQNEVWEMLRGVIDQASRRADPTYAIANAHRSVAGGTVYLEFTVVAVTDGGAPIPDPADYRGGILLTFRPTGSALLLTPRPDRAVDVASGDPAEGLAPMPDLGPCSRPP